MLRGNGGQDIFLDDADRIRFCQLAEEGVRRFDVRIPAFCLMSNHAHLAMQVAEIPLSRIIQNLTFRYTRYLNAKQHKTGHLFQGRYKAILIDAETYLLELVRYIHLNPVRAGIVQKPEDYRWSGHRAYLGMEALAWLSTDWILSQFSKHKGSARRLYREFTADGMGESLSDEFRSVTREGRILGDDDFAAEALRKAGEKPTARVSMEEIIAHVCKRFRLKPTALAKSGKKRNVSEARAMIALLVWEEDHLSLTRLGALLHRDLSSLSQSVRRLRNRMETDAFLAETANRLRQEIREIPISQA